MLILEIGHFDISSADFGIGCAITEYRQNQQVILTWVESVVFWILESAEANSDRATGKPAPAAKQENSVKIQRKSLAGIYEITY